MPDTGNIPIQILQGGSVFNVASGGTVLVASGGSIQIAAGGAFNNAGSSSMAGVAVIASGGTHLFNSGGSLQVASGGAVSVAGLETVLTGGTLLVNSGGSVQVASGGAVIVAAATGFSAPAGITLGGTAAKWSFGTLGLASGIGSASTGLTTVVSAVAVPISGVQGGAGSLSSLVVDNIGFAAGSVIFRGLAGTLAFSGAGGTIAWFAMGN